jgi:hypothetical protein
MHSASAARSSTSAATEERTGFGKNMLVKIALAGVAPRRWPLSL